jgi:hypothetical protein
MINYLELPNIKTQNCFHESGLQIINEFIIKSKTLHENIMAFKTLNILFTDNFIDNLKILPFEIASCAIFYKNSTYIADEAHIDYYNNNIVSWAINWIIHGDTETKMIWHEHDKDTNFKVSKTPAKTSYLSYSPDLKQLDFLELNNNAMLVRTDIPHSIVTNKVRVSISLRANEKDRTISWKEALFKFQNHTYE